MPTIITRGAASAKGFGFTGLTRQVTTTTFTSNGTWTAPSSVSVVSTLIGKGQDGTAAYWTGLSADVSYVEKTAPVGISSTTIEGRAQTEWDKFPTSHDPNGSTVNWTLWYYYANTTQQYAYSALVRLASGQTKTKVGNGWGSSYTTPITGQDKNYDVGNMEEYIGDATGDSSSALGYTFPGGVGGPATPATYNNVSVTPNASYSIIVPGGGYVTIQYYV